MHKSINDIFTKDGSLRLIAEEVLNGLSIKDRDKPLTETNKKAIAKVLNLVDSGTPVQDAIKQAKDESYPQSASAIAVVPDQNGTLANVIEEVANSFDSETINQAKLAFQQDTQEQMINAAVHTLTVYPPAIGDSVRGTMLESLRDPEFVRETNQKMKEAIAKVLRK